LNTKNAINQNSFSAKYNCTKLVYFEEHYNVEESIVREKSIKKWKREWKENLVDEKNIKWCDLAFDWKHYEEVK